MRNTSAEGNGNTQHIAWNEWGVCDRRSTLELPLGGDCAVPWGHSTSVPLWMQRYWLFHAEWSMPRPGRRRNSASKTASIGTCSFGRINISQSTKGPRTQALPIALGAVVPGAKLKSESRARLSRVSAEGTASSRLDLARWPWENNDAEESCDLFCSRSGSLS